MVVFQALAVAATAKDGPCVQRKAWRVPNAFKHKAKGDAIEKREQSLRKQINKFVRGMDKLEKLPLPDSGDCWYCSMRVTDGADKGKPLGDAQGDTSHILKHVKEGYLHGSLLINAMRWAGYQDVAIRYWLNSPRNNRRGVKSTLRRYLCRQLGLAA